MRKRHTRGFIDKGDALIRRTTTKTKQTNQMRQKREGEISTHFSKHAPLKKTIELTYDY